MTRNLAEYPITKEETKEIFQNALNKYTGIDVPCGSLWPSVYAQLLDNFDTVWYEVYNGKFPFEDVKDGQE
jgi:hypothetical protein